jgi:hypothetical protein
VYLFLCVFVSLSSRFFVCVSAFLPNFVPMCLSVHKYLRSSIYRCVCVCVCVCVYGKVKVKLFLYLSYHHSMKTYWGVEVQLHTFLTSVLDGGEWSNSRPGRFIPGRKNPRYLLDRRLGGPQSWCGRSGEEKNSQPPPGIKPPNPDRP